MTSQQSAFLRLPREIRDQIYKELLVHPKCVFLDILWTRPGSLCLTFVGRLMTLSPNILLTCKMVHDEGTEVLYGRNQFAIENMGNFTQFLDQIGPINSSLLRHLVIPFPHFQDDTDGTCLMLRQESNGVRAINEIEKRCKYITILETSLFSSNLWEIRLESFASPGAVDQAMALFDRLLSPITTMNQLRINLYEKPVNPALRKRLQERAQTRVTCAK